MERFVRKATAEDLPVVLDLIESGRRSLLMNISILFYFSLYSLGVIPASFLKKREKCWGYWNPR
jgi:hypothetical protein